MKFELVSHKKQPRETYEFIVHKCSTAEANAIRRVCLANIPCYAFTEIQILQNTSARAPEYISNRIEMMTVVNSDSVSDGQICNLKAECPPDADRIQVLSDYITNIQGNIDKGVVICDLEKGQRLEAKIEIKRGTASDHSRWEVTGPISYEEVSKETKGKNARDASFRSYKMVLQPLDVHTPEHILKTAMNIIISKLDAAKSVEFQDIREDEKEGTYISGIIHNDKYTVGNLISTYLNQDTNVQECAYQVATQMENYTIISIIAKDARKKYLDAIEELKSRFLSLRKQIESKEK